MLSFTSILVFEATLPDLGLADVDVGLVPSIAWNVRVVVVP